MLNLIINYSLFLLLSILFVFFTYWLNYSYKFLLILSSSETLGWMMLFLISSIFFFPIFCLYLFLVYYFSQSSSNMDFLLSLMSFPYSVPFFLKIISIGALVVFFNMSFWLVISLIFLSVLVMSILFVVFSLNSLSISTMKSSMTVIFVSPLLLFLLGYCKMPHTFLMSSSFL